MAGEWNNNGTLKLVKITSYSTAANQPRFFVIFSYRRPGRVQRLSQPVIPLPHLLPGRKQPPPPQHHDPHRHVRVGVEYSVAEVIVRRESLRLASGASRDAGKLRKLFV